MAFGTAVKIETITVAAGGTSSIIFNNIPQTYNDLKVIVSGRGTRNFETDDLVIRFNGSSTNYSGRRLYSGGGAPGSSATSDTLTDIRGFVPGSPTTADVFGSNEFYIPNYTSSNNKAVHVYGGGENNGLVSYLGFTAGLWSSASAITSITMLANNGNLTEFSTFTLYGITRIPQSAKATGGVITDTSTHWIHTFTSSGTFTPNQNITCEYLVVAGGGGGGRKGGGGGAGGYRCAVSGETSGRGASAESTISLVNGTSYTITIGGGGAGATITSSRGTNGADSSIAGSGLTTITSTGGGGGGSDGGGVQSGANGGSGGGAAGGGYGSGGGGTGTNAQGYDGATNTASSPYAGGGGGGAGQAGNTNGTGGNGQSSSITGTSVIRAGGGGGGADTGTAWPGGNGGGGTGGIEPTIGTAGTTNTGSGGGGGPNSANGSAGGSGIVIVRYAK